MQPLGELRATSPFFSLNGKCATREGPQQRVPYVQWHESKVENHICTEGGNRQVQKKNKKKGSRSQWHAPRRTLESRVECHRSADVGHADGWHVIDPGRNEMELGEKAEEGLEFHQQSGSTRRQNSTFWTAPLQSVPR